MTTNDNYNKDIHIKQHNPFYNEWWFWLLIIAIAIILIVVFVKNHEIIGTSETTEKEVIRTKAEVIVKPEEAIEIEETDGAVSDPINIADPVYTYEDFRGTYVTFEGEPYETPISALIYMDDFYYFIFYPQKSDSHIHNISSRTIEKDVLYLDLFLEERTFYEGGGVTIWSHQLALGHQDDKKFLHDTSSGILFYNMSDEQIMEYQNFNTTPSQLAEEWREITKTTLAGYDVHEIDYARIIMMTGTPRISPEEPSVSVSQIPAGSPIFNVEGSPTYPENATRLRTNNRMFSNHDIFSIVYVVRGDGYITIYPQPSNYEIDIEPRSDQDYLILAQRILDNAETVYVNPSNPYKVADFIDRVKFSY